MHLLVRPLTISAGCVKAGDQYLDRSLANIEGHSLLESLYVALEETEPTEKRPEWYSVIGPPP